MLLYVSVFLLSLVGAEGSTVRGAGTEFFSIEDTVRMARGIGIDPPGHRDPRVWRGNPQACSAILAAIEAEKDREAKADMVHYLGFIGGPKEVSAIEKMILRWVRTEGEEGQSCIEGAMHALAYMSFRGVEGAREALKAKLDPRFWELHPPKWFCGSYSPSVYAVWRTLYAYAKAGDAGFPELAREVLSRLEQKYGKIPLRGDIEALLRKWETVDEELRKSLADSCDIAHLELNLQPEISLPSPTGSGAVPAKPLSESGAVPTKPLSEDEKKAALAVAEAFLDALQQGDGQRAVALCIGDEDEWAPLREALKDGPWPGAAAIPEGAVMRVVQYPGEDGGMVQRYGARCAILVFVDKSLIFPLVLVEDTWWICK